MNSGVCVQKRSFYHCPSGQSPAVDVIRRTLQCRKGLHSTNATVILDNGSFSSCICRYGFLALHCRCHCFLPYTQGPCPNRSILVKRHGKARCVEDRCDGSGGVYCRSTRQCERGCYAALGSCSENDVVINASTMDINCPVRSLQDLDRSGQAEE